MLHGNYLFSFKCLIWNWFGKWAEMKMVVSYQYSRFFLLSWYKMSIMIFLSFVLQVVLPLYCKSEQKLIFKYHESLKFLFHSKFCLFLVLRDCWHKESLKTGYLMKRDCNGHTSAPAPIICLHVYSRLWQSTKVLQSGSTLEDRSEMAFRFTVSHEYSLQIFLGPLKLSEPRFPMCPLISNVSPWHLAIFNTYEIFCIRKDLCGKYYVLPTVP